MFDGIGVHVRRQDLDKTRSNSNYFRELTSLLKLFDETQPRLNAVSNVDPQSYRLSYPQALTLAGQKIKVWINRLVLHFASVFRVVSLLFREKLSALTVVG